MKKKERKEKRYTNNKLLINKFMKNEISTNKEYKEFLTSVKTRIHSAQIKAALTVNKELINLYWELG